MPSKSKKQRRFMAAAANNPEFAEKADIPQSVAKEFARKDKMMKRSDMKSQMDGGKKNKKKYKSGGKVRGAGCAKQGVKKAKVY